MALNYWDYKRNEDLLDDELIQKAFELLRKRRKELSEWIEEHDPVCKKCGTTKDMEYQWNKKICHNCNYKEDYNVPPPVNGGKTMSRKISQIIKELFGMELGKRKKDQKPKPKDLRELSFSLDSFSDAQYTDSEIEFLNRRYSQLLDEIGGRGNYVDMFQVYQLAEQELKIMNMNRLDKFEKVSATDRKREMDIYRNLVKDLKAAKADRDDVEEQTIIQELAEKAHALELDKEIQEHVKYLETEYKDYLKMSKERRKKKGNPY
ncbi:MAG: hypothetical protein ACOCQD_05270 [archaeon]